MVQEKGILHLWRGLGSTLWRDVPFSGLILFFKKNKNKIMILFPQNDNENEKIIIL